MQVIIKFEDATHQGQRRWIRSGQRLTLGRSGLADIVVDDESILPFHLVIEFTDSGCAILAAPGTFFNINGQLQSSAWLQHNDLVAFGLCRFRVETDGVDALVVPAAPPSLVLANSASNPVAIAPTLHAVARPHDEQFLRVEPHGSVPWSAADLAMEINQHVAVLGLCRFDPWTLPCPSTISDQLACVPAAEKPRDARYLPLLFPLNEVDDPATLIRDGFNSGDFMLLFARTSFADVLVYLRNQCGLFLSPHAMLSVLQETQPGAVDAIFGPLDGIILGGYQNWQMYYRRDSLEALEQRFAREDISLESQPA